MFSWLKNIFKATPTPPTRPPGLYECTLCHGTLSQGEDVWVSAGAYFRCRHIWVTKTERKSKRYKY